jgi:hypothetical protein
MHKCIYLSVGCALLLASRPGSAQTPTEKVEKRLTELLAPGKTSASGDVGAPVGWKKTLVSLDTFTAIDRAVATAPVRYTSPALKAVKPRSAPEGTPLVSYREQVQAPKDVELPTKPLIKLPSVDVHTPAPIPILAQPSKDRASLGDPALDASLEAALKQLAPRRVGPVPFIPYNLPDPFENLRYGQLRNPPAENPTPPVIPLTKPTTK